MDGSPESILDVARAVLADLDPDIVPERVLRSGELYLTERLAGAAFSELDEQAVTMLAMLAGVAIDHAHRYSGASERGDELARTVVALEATAVTTARSVARERQRYRLVAAEDERRRWARELHDETLQSLSALRIAMSGARRSGQPEALARAVSASVEQLEEMIANLRALITDLRPAALDELGITAALEGLAESSHVHEIDVALTIALEGGRGTRADRLDPELETSMYRIVQEALTNAAKHGRAAHAEVEVREDDRGIHLIVRDDGSGFDTEAGSGGFGLLGMGERVELLGGELTLESSPGHGTTVTVVLPAHSPPAARVAALP